MSDREIKPIYQKFNSEGQIQSAELIGSGHIHKTYLVKTGRAEHPGYILQKFNHRVFPNVEQVMENIRSVSHHLRDNPEYSNRYQIPELVECKSGGYYYAKPDGSFWRMYNRITPGISYDTIPGESVAYEAGKIYGSFISGLNDFPADNLHIVIPGFHSVQLRYRQLMNAIKADSARRVANLNDEIRFAKNHADAMMQIPEPGESQNLPVRVTHNDTKLNNILFDEENRATAVVDLDTVMPGLSLYDFGDLVRSAANTAKENESGRSDTGFSLPVFSAIAKGFLEESVELLTSEEVSMLPLAPQYMAYLMGIRFLADYINGDIYYNIRYPEQNLDRCRAQFRLMESLIEAYDDCVAIILYHR